MPERTPSGVAATALLLATALVGALLAYLLEPAGRPWAKNWEKYFEADWDKPQEELPRAITDIFSK